MNDTFKVTIDGTETEFRVRRPTAAEQRESEKVYRRTFRECLDNGDFVRQKLDDKLREQGLWDDKKQLQHDTLIREMTDGRKTLLRKKDPAGNPLKLSDAKAIALNILDKRNELLQLLITRNQLDSHTAEAQAENAKFNYLVSCCVVYNTTNKPYFKNLDDYIERGTSEVAVKGATALMKILMDVDDNEDANSIENKFLKNWKFVDDKGRLVNKEGHLVDRDGRLIDENGYFVDEHGNRVDIDGNPVNEDGTWKFEEAEFVDDEGNPLKEPEPTVEPNTTVELAEEKGQPNEEAISPANQA